MARSSPIDKVLGRLEGVKATGEGRWMARCPAHEDRSPSLSVRELEDGRILIHCFAGCEAGDVLKAIGRTMDDLFTQPREHSRRPVRGGFTAAELLTIIAHETYVVWILAYELQRRLLVTDEEFARLNAAAARIGKAQAYARE